MAASGRAAMDEFHGLVTVRIAGDDPGDDIVVNGLSTMVAELAATGRHATAARALLAIVEACEAASTGLDPEMTG
jgi:hypothetical protein